MKTRLIVCLLLGLLFGQQLKAQQPHLAITVPSAGQVFHGYDTVTVQWTNSGSAANEFQILLSIDGGVSYAYNFNPIQGLGASTIIMPNISSTNCQFLVWAGSDGEAFPFYSSTFTIETVTPTFSVTGLSDTSICFESPLRFVPQINGGQAPYTLIWYGGENATSNQLTCIGCDSVVYDMIYTEGEFTTTVVVKDANGAIGIDSSVVNIYPIPRFTFNSNYFFPYGGITCGSIDTLGPVMQTSGPRVLSYQWYDLPDLTTVVGDSMHFIANASSGSGINTYILYGTDQYGCKVGYDTVPYNFTCNALPVLANNDCYQLGTPDSSGGGFDFFYLHVLANDVFDTTGNNYNFRVLNDPVTGSVVYFGWNSQYPTIPAYFILAVPTSALAQPDSFQYVLIDYHSPNLADTAWVHINTTCPADLGLVWPGDTRDDGYVDNSSLLPIGIGYGTSGPVRSGATISWTGQNCSDWADSLATGSNYKYIDCNGDGAINADDTMAIHNNFFQVHARSGGPQSAGTGAPVLNIYPVEDTVLNGDTLHAIISLGDSSIPANDVYGIAFDIHIDPLVVDTNYVTIKYVDSWLGNTTDVLTLSKNFSSQGLIKTAVTRYDHIGRSGYGTIATVDFLITTSNINGKNLEYYQAILNTASILMLDSVGNPLPVNASINSSRVGFYQTTLSTQQLQADNVIKVFPNPANTQIFISANHSTIHSVKISNMLGQEVAAYNPNSNLLQADVSQLANGIYIAEIETGTGKISKRIVIAK